MKGAEKQITEAESAFRAFEAFRSRLDDDLAKPGSGRALQVVEGFSPAGAVVDRLGIPGFLVGAEIAAGVPVLRAVGASNGDMLLALKSGNFGGPEFFSDALDLMR